MAYRYTNPMAFEAFYAGQKYAHAKSWIQSARSPGLPPEIRQKAIAWARRDWHEYLQATARVKALTQAFSPVP